MPNGPNPGALLLLGLNVEVIGEVLELCVT